MACVRRWWLPALLIFVVGGLISMHGVGPWSASPQAAAMSMASGSVPHHSGDPADTRQPSSHTGMHFAGLCMAVLVSAWVGRAARRLVGRPFFPPALRSGIGSGRRVNSRPLRPPGLDPPVLGVALC